MTGYTIERDNAERDWDALRAILDNDGIVAGDVQVLEQIAKSVRAQIPKPAVKEPTAFGSIVRAVCAHGTEYQLWQRSPMQGKHYWESEHGIVEVWSDLTHVEVLRVGIGEPAPMTEEEIDESQATAQRNFQKWDPVDTSYHRGRENFANAMRRDVSGLLADAITAERRDAYDKVLASISALLGES